MVKNFRPVALKSAISGLALGPKHPQILPNPQYSDQHLTIFGLSNPLFSGLTSRGASGGLQTFQRDVFTIASDLVLYSNAVTLIDTA